VNSSKEEEMIQRKELLIQFILVNDVYVNARNNLIGWISKHNDGLNE